MQVRRLRQILFVLAAIGLSAPLAAAEDPYDVPQAVDSIDESESSTEPFIDWDEPDPLFDDDFDLETVSGYPDPLEEANRKVFTFNQGLDRYFLGPIASFFGYVTPGPVKQGLRNFFDNLNTPVVFINDALQLEWKDVAVTTAGFVVNTTVGIAGLFEPAKHIGLPRHVSDFGQTLALARMPSGPYLVIPVAGPSTARGTVGSVVDLMLRPTTWFLPVTTLFSTGGEGVVRLEEHQGELEELERSSVDFYAVLRSAYRQTREDQIWRRRQHRLPPTAK